ncbi:hypothetical protein WME76_38625 [Sorangium sp. So ce119]
MNGPVYIVPIVAPPGELRSLSDSAQAAFTTPFVTACSATSVG